MISNPLPATVMPSAQGTASIPAAVVTSGDLDLFTEQTTKAEETKKQLSKDCLIPVWRTSTAKHSHKYTIYLTSTNHTSGFSFHGRPSACSSRPYRKYDGTEYRHDGAHAHAQTGVMPLQLPQNVVGPQGGMVGQMGAPQSKFSPPQAQQPQWNLSQMSQQMTAMNLSSANASAGFGQPP